MLAAIAAGLLLSVAHAKQEQNEAKAEVWNGMVSEYWKLQNKKKLKKKHMKRLEELADLGVWSATANYT